MRMFMVDYQNRKTLAFTLEDAAQLSGVSIEDLMLEAERGSFSIFPFTFIFREEVLYITADDFWKYFIERSGSNYTAPTDIYAGVNLFSDEKLTPITYPLEMASAVSAIPKSKLLALGVIGRVPIVIIGKGCYVFSCSLLGIMCEIENGIIPEYPHFCSSSDGGYSLMHGEKMF